MFLINFPNLNIPHLFFFFFPSLITMKALYWGCDRLNERTFPALVRWLASSARPSGLACRAQEWSVPVRAEMLKGSTEFMFMVEIPRVWVYFSMWPDLLSPLSITGAKGCHGLEFNGQKWHRVKLKSSSCPLDPSKGSEPPPPFRGSAGAQPRQSKALNLCWTPRAWAPLPSLLPPLLLPASLAFPQPSAASLLQLNFLISGTQNQQKNHSESTGK